MNIQNYQRLKRYALRIRGNYDNVDIVHDAYIYWLENKGKDLFDENNATACTVIKNLSYHLYEKKYIFMSNGEKLHRSFNSLESVENYGFDDEESTSDVEKRMKSILTSRRPDEERYMETVSKNNDRFVYIFDRLVEGYSQVEIAKDLEVTPAYISWSVIKMRKMLCSVY